LNVVSTELLTAPQAMKQELPLTAAANQVVVESRETIKAILSGEDPRLLIVIGPCSIHDEKAALEYAERLVSLRDAVAEQLFVVMRVYFEKPRTTVGWKGLISDPHLDGSFDMGTGLRKARRLLLSIAELGLPTGTEMLEPITPQYIDDLVSWSAIGARTTESQTHRQMASGLSMPVGFKNGTDGNLQVAIDAMISSRSPHGFLGIDADGRTAIIRTRGNPWGHTILRGGRGGPNYDAASVAGAIELLKAKKLPEAIMVDTSHANSSKKHQNQHLVWEDVIAQRVAGNRQLIGMMVESNLECGAQKLGEDRSQLKYGVSITDECIGWEETERLLQSGAAALR
jgi:3-deoxy-7-phosphoheptulonate synthase